jgi:hypothetical protein
MGSAENGRGCCRPPPLLLAIAMCTGATLRGPSIALHTIEQIYSETWPTPATRGDACSIARDRKQHATAAVRYAQTPHTYERTRTEFERSCTGVAGSREFALKLRQNLS